MTNFPFHARGRLVFILVVLVFLAWALVGQQGISAIRAETAAAGGGRVEAWQVWERSWLQQYRPLLAPGLFTLAMLLVGLRVWLLHPRMEDWEGVDWPHERLPLRKRRKRKAGAGS